MFPIKYDGSTSALNADGAKSCSGLKVYYRSQFAGAKKYSTDPLSNN